MKDKNGDPENVALGLSDLMAALSVAAETAGRRAPAVFLVLPPGAKAGRLADGMKDVVHPAIRRLARAQGVNLVAPVLRPECGAYKLDMVHLSAEGAAKVAHHVATAILSSS